MLCVKADSEKVRQRETDRAAGHIQCILYTSVLIIILVIIIIILGLIINHVLYFP